LLQQSIRRLDLSAVAALRVLRMGHPTALAATAQAKGNDYPTHFHVSVIVRKAKILSLIGR
jgi:hypothetical protein